MEKKNLEPRTQNRQDDGTYSYRNLILWQKSQELTLAILELVAAFPRGRVAEVMTDQIVRASSSIGANLAEGHGRYSLPAHANYLSIAKASACETDNFLDLAHRAGFVSAEVEQRLHRDCTEIIRMLTCKILDLGRQQKAKNRSTSLGEETAIYGTTDYSGEDPVLGSRF